MFVGADGYVLTECIPIALYSTCPPDFLLNYSLFRVETNQRAKKIDTSQSDNTTLLGSTRRDYYNILKWMSLANSDLLPAQGGVILPIIGRPETIRKNTEDYLRALHKNFRLLESQLQKTKYLVGEQLTLADFFAVGMLVFSFMVFHKMLQQSTQG